MRGAPGDLLHPHVHPGVLALESLHQLGHHFAFAAEAPEAQGVRGLDRAAGGEQEEGEGEQQVPFHSGPRRVGTSPPRGGRPEVTGIFPSTTRR